jgi:iron complex transport system substrate-binding protein
VYNTNKAICFLSIKKYKIKILADKMTLVSNRVKDLKPENKLKTFCLWGDADLTTNLWGTWNQNTSAHQLITLAGGINIAADLKVNYPKVSQEWVLSTNPSVIILPTFDKKGILGYDANNDTNAKKLWENTINNPIISKTNAGKNNKVYIMSAKIQQGILSYLGTLYLAKYLYPDRFKDVNPNHVLREYFEKWLGIPFKGIWVYPAP